MRVEHRNALIVVAAACVLGPAFGVSFILAVDHPALHDVPAGVVIDPATRQAVALLEGRTNGGLAFHPYPTTGAVANAIEQQQIFAGVVPAGAGARLLVAGAAGSSVASILRRAAGSSLPVDDLRPLPNGDSAGLIPFYLTLAATITGFVTMLQLRTYACQLSLRAWFLCVGGLPLIAAGLLAILTGPVMGAQHGLLPEVWALIAGTVAIAALWASTMEVLAGAWMLVPTFGFLMVLGIPAPGGAVAAPRLPAFYSFLYRFAPPGAAMESLRNELYFHHAQLVEPFLVLAAWIVGILAALLLGARFRGRTPGGQTWGGPRRPPDARGP